MHELVDRVQVHVAAQVRQPLGGLLVLVVPQLAHEVPGVVPVGHLHAPQGQGGRDQGRPEDIGHFPQDAENDAREDEEVAPERGQ